MNYPDLPRCQYCGKFISSDDLKNPTLVGCRTVWDYHPTPEPLYDVIWHVACEAERHKYLKKPEDE